VGNVLEKFGKVKTEVRLGSIARQDLQDVHDFFLLQHFPPACHREPVKPALLPARESRSGEADGDGTAEGNPLARR